MPKTLHNKPPTPPPPTKKKKKPLSSSSACNRGGFCFAGDHGHHKFTIPNNTRFSSGLDKSHSDSSHPNGPRAIMLLQLPVSPQAHTHLQKSKSFYPSTQAKAHELMRRGTPFTTQAH